MALKTDPAQGATAITPNNAVDLASPTTGIYVGTTGNLRLTTVLGDDVTFVAVPSGALLPVQATRIWATGTTATNIISLRTNATGIPS